MKIRYDDEWKKINLINSSIKLNIQLNLDSKNIKLITIKNLIDSFTVSDEKFIDNKYYAKFNVNFNKKSTLKFFQQSILINYF